MRKLKVYEWTHYRSGQVTYRITVAPSKAEVARINNTTVARMWNLSETKDPKAIEAAMSKPGVIFEEPGIYQRVYAEVLGLDRIA